MRLVNATTTSSVTHVHPILDHIAARPIHACTAYRTHPSGPRCYLLSASRASISAAGFLAFISTNSSPPKATQFRLFLAPRLKRYIRTQNTLAEITHTTQKLASPISRRNFFRCTNFHPLVSMDKTSTTRDKGAAESIFHELDGRGAILSVARDRVEVLRPQDTHLAIGVRDLDGYSCLILMGTSPKSAIITAHISVLDGEEHYMSLLRLMVSIFVKEQHLFQLPLAWGIFSHHHKDGFPFNHLAERTLRVFQHLHVKLHISHYDLYDQAEAHSSPGRHTVVAVRHEAELPEMYIEDRLVYPSVHSGSLALEFNRLGLRQIDYEHGDDEEISTSRNETTGRSTKRLQNHNEALHQQPLRRQTRKRRSAPICGDGMEALLAAF